VVDPAVGEASLGEAAALISSKSPPPDSIVGLACGAGEAIEDELSFVVSAWTDTPAACSCAAATQMKSGVKSWVSSTPKRVIARSPEDRYGARRDIGPQLATRLPAARQRLELCPNPLEELFRERTANSFIDNLLSTLGLTLQRHTLRHQHSLTDYSIHSHRLR
jgi:hypothetical protein